MSHIYTLTLFLVLLSSCATSYTISQPVSSGDRYFLPVTWYGTAFHGKQTASGSSFDAQALTCAAHHFPFGTCLKITNPENKKSVVVTVNDRPGKSVIDLSKAAFSHIAKNDVGRLYARVVVLASCPNSSSIASQSVTTTKNPQPLFTIEIARFDNLEEAGAYLDSLNIPEGYIFTKKQGDNIFHVRASSFSDRQSAHVFIQKYCPQKGAVIVERPH